MTQMAGDRPVEGTRERLLESTWRIIRDEGLRAATSRRIADVAGANLGAITYHFGSKDALISEAAVAGMSAWTKPMTDALLHDEHDGGDRTGAVIGSLLGLLETGGADARALLETAVAQDVDDVVNDTLRSHLSDFQHVVADLIRRQQERGEVTESVEPDAMAGFFTAVALGLITQEVIGANPAPIPEIVGELLKLLTESKPQTTSRSSDMTSETV